MCRADRTGKFRIALVMGCLLIAGASGTTAAKTVLTMMYHGQPTAEWKRIEETYEKSHPNIDIKMVANADSWPGMFEKLAIMNAAGSAVDIIHVNRESMGFANRGLFVDLTSYMRSAKLNRNIMPGGSWRQFMLKGKLVAIPFALFPGVMLYNENLFAQAGLPPVPKDWTEKTFTVDTMAAMLRKLTKDANGDGKRDQYGTADWMVEAILKAYGAEWVDPDTNKATANSKAMVDAYTFWYDLKNTSRVVLDEEGQSRLKINWDYFSSGKIGMLASGTWSFGMNAKNSFRWDVGIMPKGAQRATNMTVDGIAMGSLSRKKADAWDFIKWLTYDKSGATLLNDAMQGVPSMKSLIGRFIDREQAANPRLTLKVVEDSLDYGSITNLHLYSKESEMTRNINEQLQLVDKGRKSLISALDAIQGILPRLMKQ